MCFLLNTVIYKLLANRYEVHVIAGCAVEQRRHSQRTSRRPGLAEERGYDRWLSVTGHSLFLLAKSMLRDRVDGDVTIFLAEQTDHHNC